MNNQQRAAMIRPRGKSEAPHMIAAYRAMQMALEALKVAANGDDYWSYDEAIAALKEALAQPDHIANAGKVIEPSYYDREFWDDGQPQGEWVDLTDDELEEVLAAWWKEDLSMKYADLTRSIIAKFKSKNAPVVQQDHSGEATDMVQAPVAWHEPGSYGNVTTHKDWALANGWEPLYKEKNT